MSLLYLEKTNFRQLTLRSWLFLALYALFSSIFFLVQRLQVTWRHFLFQMTESQNQRKSSLHCFNETKQKQTHFISFIQCTFVRYSNAIREKKQLWAVMQRLRSTTVHCKVTLCSHCHSFLCGSDKLKPKYLFRAVSQHNVHCQKKEATLNPNDLRMWWQINMANCHRLGSMIKPFLFYYSLKLY